MASDPYQYVDQTGVIVPDTSNILTDVQAEYTDVFGADLVTTPDTPQGVLISAEALARIQVVKNNAALANEINPNIAGGVFLDALLALTGMQRTKQTQTLVANVALAGVPGTLIPAGAQAQTSAGDIFQSTGDVTLDSSGLGAVNFVAINYGPVPCAANALSHIVSSVLGWETINNPAAGILGLSTQSDQAARALRQNTLAFQGVSLANAITSALYATEGVTNVAFLENVSSTTQVIEGISLIGHSIYACVAGGTDQAVAAALLENKSSGCAWNGNTTVSVVEPASGQYYNVQFQRPNQIGILIRVTTTNGDSAAIIQSILDYAAGKLNNLAGFIIGGDVSPFELSGAIMTENPGFYIAKVEIATTDLPITYATDVIPIGLDQQAFTLSTYITVVNV